MRTWPAVIVTVALLVGCSQEDDDGPCPPTVAVNLLVRSESIEAVPFTVRVCVTGLECVDERLRTRPGERDLAATVAVPGVAEDAAEQLANEEVTVLVDDGRRPVTALAVMLWEEPYPEGASGCRFLVADTGVELAGGPR